jgi:phage shock protein PspC (stress-responsive transcriptional regulator)
MSENANQQVAGTAPPNVRRLVRRTDGKMVAGVATGLGEYFGVDPVWFRLGFVVSTLLGGAGILAYGALWLVMPEGSAGQPTPLEVHAERVARSMHGVPAWVGVGLLILGSLLVVTNVLNLRPGVFWGIALMLGGIMLFRGLGGRGAELESPLNPPPVPTAPLTDPSGAGSPPGLPDPGWVAPSGPPAARRARSKLGLLTIGAVMVAEGTAAALDAGGALEVSLVQYLALALAVIGLGMIAGTWWGRARWLIVPGVLLIPFVLLASLIKVPFDGGFGDAVYRPATAQAIENEYHLVGGQMTIDLSETTLAPGPTRIVATVVGGRILIEVPAGVLLEVHARAGAGEVSIFGRTYDGINVDVRRTFGAALTPRPASTLQLELEASFGQVEVRT